MLNIITKIKPKTVIEIGIAVFTLGAKVLEIKKGHITDDEKMEKLAEKAADIVQERMSKGN